MPNTIFIDTNKLPRKETPQGDVTEILNSEHARSVVRVAVPANKGA